MKLNSSKNKIFEQNNQPKKGMLLLSEPFMNDDNFKRTVILLAEHVNDGTLGFIVNRPLDINLDQIMPEILIPNITVFSGGPVAPDSLHYLHNVPNIIKNSTNILTDVYWGGDFNDVINGLNSGEITNDQIKFFVGYSGWDKEQIEQEIKEETWFVTDATKDDVYCVDFDKLWSKILNDLGGKFKQIANYPENPIWN